MLKFKVDKTKLKMEISIEDLIQLFEKNPWNNMASEPFATVKPERKKDFVKAFLAGMQEEFDRHRCPGIPVWALSFEHVFEQILESCDDYLKYHEEEVEI